MNDPETILLKILDVIGYSGDKEKFSTEFLENVNMQSISDLINSLSSDKQQEIKQKISLLQNDPKAAGDIIKTYFAEQQLNEALQNSFMNAVTEYIDTIEPTLSDSQKQNLASYFSELAKTASPVAA